ncbi:MAG: hypothetical protein ACPG4T_08455 [Nannocystaceae bacterium]
MKNDLPHQVVAVVGSSHACVSAPVLALTHAARAASLTAHVYRHSDAQPPIEPLLFVCPEKFLPHAEITTPRRHHTVLACPTSGRPQLGPTAPLWLADTAVWVVAPDELGLEPADTLLQTLRGAGLSLAAVWIQAATQHPDLDFYIRHLRENLCLHNYDGDAIPILCAPALIPPGQAPKAFDQTLSAALTLLEHLDHAPLSDSPETSGTPWLSLGDARRLKPTETYVVARLRRGRLTTLAKLQLTRELFGVEKVVTRVLQRRGGQPPDKEILAGEIVWMHVEHRNRVRVVPGMYLFEDSASFQRAQKWEVALDPWGELSNRVLLCVAGLKAWADVAHHADNRATLTCTTNMYMPVSTPFHLSVGGQIVAVGHVTRPMPAGAATSRTGG